MKCDMPETMAQKPSAGQMGSAGGPHSPSLFPQTALGRMASGIPGAFPGSTLEDGQGLGSGSSGLPPLGRYNSVLNDGLFTSLQVSPAQRHCRHSNCNELHCYSLGSLLCLGHVMYMSTAIVRRCLQCLHVSSRLASGHCCLCWLQLCSLQLCRKGRQVFCCPAVSTDGLLCTCRCRQQVMPES